VRWIRQCGGWTSLMLAAWLAGPVVAQEAKVSDHAGDLEAYERPVAGTLFLVGGGRIPEELRQEFFKLGGCSTGTLVLIPGASQDAETKAWAELVSPWDHMGWNRVYVWQPGASVLRESRDR
jgi:hypothetical protein